MLFVGAVAFAVYAVVSQNWLRLLYAGFLLVFALGNLSLNRRILRSLREQESTGR